MKLATSPNESDHEALALQSDSPAKPIALLKLIYLIYQIYQIYQIYRIRSELVTTKRLESAIAAAPYIGCSKPSAATGIPITL